MKETIRGFKAIVDGEMDDYPEAAFFNVGTIDEVVERAKEMGIPAQNKEGLNYANTFSLKVIACDRNFLRRQMHTGSSAAA